MYHDAQHGVPEQFQILSAEDAAEIDKGARMSPSKWFVDPVLDNSTYMPRVWVRQSPSNAMTMSIGFSKWQGMFLVTVCHSDGSAADDEGTPYGDLSTAFSSIGGVLLMMQDSRQESSTVAQTR